MGIYNEMKSIYFFLLKKQDVIPSFLLSGADACEDHTLDLGA